MTTAMRLTALLWALAWAVPAASQTEVPKVLHPHPDRELADDAGPFWLAVSEMFRPDGTVRDEETVGRRRVASVARRVAQSRDMKFDPSAPDCYVEPKTAASRRELIDMPGRTVFLPGDFTGWVAVSEAVVVGTVAKLVPGLSARGRPNTLAVLEDVEHLYPSKAYPHQVKYLILPYAQFVAGGAIFCHPWAESQEYYASVGDRLLIAAEAPADREGLAIAVRSMSRIVKVERDGTLVTFGNSEFDPVDFDLDFPAALDEARTRTRTIWRNGLVDSAAQLGVKAFTQAWKNQKQERDALRSRGCAVDEGELRSVDNAWSFVARCPGDNESTRQQQ